MKIIILSISLLILLTAAYYYVIHFKCLINFVQHAATSPLFGSSDATIYQRIVLWADHTGSGIFMTGTCILASILFLAGVLRTIVLLEFNNLTKIFFVAVFQIGIFLLAWSLSFNDDPRYFLPTLPYFAVLVCWGLTSINTQIITKALTAVFLIQFALVNGFAFGWNKLEPAYGLIRPVVRDNSREMGLLNGVMHLSRRNSSKSVFDTGAALETSQIGYALAKQNLLGEWWGRYLTIESFFDRQEIDHGKINIENAWKSIIAYNPEFYFTLDSRLSTAQPIQRERYASDLETARNIIAWRIMSSDLYERVALSPYPQILVYKRCDVRLD